VREHPHGAVADRRIHGGRVERQKIPEHAVLRAQLFVDGIGEVGIRRAEQAQAGRVGDVEPREQQLFRYREDGRVRADRQGERDRGDEGEPAALAKQAPGKGQVIPQHGEHPGNVNEKRWYGISPGSQSAEI
jgi:hypothetical protein